MQIQLYLLTVERYPEAFTEEDSVLLVETGAESQDMDNPIPLDDLWFMTTLLVNASEAEPAVSEFREWWGSQVGGHVSLELLAEHPTQLSRSRAESLAEIERGAWSFRTSFMAFAEKCDEARVAARKFICEAELSIQ